jgi:hypothetical protein
MNTKDFLQLGVPAGPGKDPASEAIADRYWIEL